MLGGAFPLGFARGRYGPYAERLPQVLDLLEGHYLSGCGDHSARVEELAPIVPLDRGLAEAEAVVGASAEDVEVIGARVAGWSLRKARLFGQEHVRIAAERLAESGLLPGTAVVDAVP